MQRIAGFSSFRRRVLPTNVPVVPRPATKWVMVRFVCFQISGVSLFVRVKIFFAVGLVDFADAADGAVGAFVSWRKDDFDAVGCEDVFALGRGAGGKAEFDAIA